MSKNYTTERLNKLQIKCYLGQRTKCKVLILTLQRLGTRGVQETQHRVYPKRRVIKMENKNPLGAATRERYCFFILKISHNEV
jgi:hypothetical protein